MTDGFWHTFTCPHCQRKHVAWVEPQTLPFSDNARRVLAFAPEVWKRGTPVPLELLAQRALLSRETVRKVLRRELVPQGYAVTLPNTHGRGVRYVGVYTMIETVKERLIA